MGAPDQTRDEAGAIVAWLADRDEPCPVCGYNLRGSPAASCAECGSPLSLTVASSRLKDGPWLLAFAAFVMALGFDAVTSLLMMIPLAVSFFLGQGMPPPEFWIILSTMIVLSVVSAGGAFVLIRKRGAWRLMKRRRAAAIAVFGGVGLFHLAAGAVLVLSMI